MAKLNINYSSDDFVQAAANNDIHILDLFLKSGLNPNLNNSIGQNALLEATNKENLDIIKLLIKNGADPTVQNIAGENALLYASLKPSLTDALSIFLKNKEIDVNKLILGNSIAMFAAEKANRSAFDLITQNNINAKVKNENGETLLHHAVRGGDTDIKKNASFRCGCKSNR